MIRLATEADIPRLLEMGLRFRRETGYSKHIEENPEQMERLVRQIIAADGVLVSEQAGEVIGMIGYVLYPHFLSGELIAGEVFFWVEPGHRGDGLRLLRGAEKRAKDRGANRMQMIAPTDRVGRLYGRFGYEFVEATYQKNL
jgi:GNAT superfamily N-acetyltransferase